VLALGLALAAPALTADFTADDHLHRVVSRATPAMAGLHSRPLDLFVFATGDLADATALRESGTYPWWVDPKLKLAFFRPLSSLTHAIDHLLWPDSAPLHLAHNLVWLALSLVALWRLYRRLFAEGPGALGSWVAVLALALYALDDARGPVVGWIANRNSLIALALGIPALIAHDRWRRGRTATTIMSSVGGWRAAIVGPAWFAAALCAGESAIAVLAYLAAYALWLDRAPLRARALSLLPYLGVLVAWRVVYVALGYGVAGSGIYLDPGTAPGSFAAAAIERIPLLLLGQLGLPWSDAASVYPLVGAMGLMVGVAVIFLVIVGLACARLLRRDPLARFFATGMVLSAVPIASTFPADRLLGFVGIGGAGLVAQLIAATLRERTLLGDGALRRGASTVVTLVLVVVNLIAAPPLLALRSRSMVTVARVIERADAGIPYDASRTVIIISTPSDALVGFIPLMRESRHQPCPAHLHWLATATTAVTVERVDDHTLRIEPAGGLLPYALDRMMRSPHTAPFAAGDRVELSAMTITIEAITPDGRPSVFLARFREPLDAITFLRWGDTSYIPYTPPATRETLPAADFAKLLE
jgi:hypothetical protein